MSVTRAQVNAVKATILDRAFNRYPQFRIPAVRMAIQIAKNGTAIQQESVRAILQDAYLADTGRDPLDAKFSHNFKQWLREALEDVTGADPTTGLIRSDAFDPAPVVIT